MKQINLNNLQNEILNLKAGEQVLLTGTVFTARDAAHKKLQKLINEKKDIPNFLQNHLVYYCGPTPKFGNRVIGSAGPTTSSRMDIYVNDLLKNKIAGFIGKGKRNQEVIDSIVKHKSIYFAAYGGIGAFLSSKITKSEVVAYPELGPEAIFKLQLNNFPAIVAIDSTGNNIFNK